MVVFLNSLPQIIALLTRIGAFGQGVPKYKLYRALFDRVKPEGESNQFTKHEEEFIDLLMRSRIHLSQDDYNQNVTPNLGMIYTGACYLKLIADPDPTSKLKDGIDGKNLTLYLDAVEQRYKEFSDLYERISSKGYPATATHIKRQITLKKEEDKSSKQQRPISADQVNLATFRNNFIEYIAPQPNNDKKSFLSLGDSEDKEIDIAASAKTNQIDSEPIIGMINKRTIYITPSKVRKQMLLSSNIERRSAGAAQKLKSEKEGTSTSLTTTQINTINTGIEEYILTKEKHEEDKYIRENLATVGSLSSKPLIENELFHDLPEETAAHVLAITAILAESKTSNVKIEKDMSISRLVVVGQINKSYSRPSLFAPYRMAQSTETMKEAIDKKLGANSPDGKRLKATIDTFSTIAGESLDPIELMNTYADDIIFDTRPSKKPMDSIVEFCEADATAKEYIQRTENVLKQSADYLIAESDIAITANLKNNQTSDAATKLRSYATTIKNGDDFNLSRDRGDRDDPQFEDNKDDQEIDNESNLPSSQGSAKETNVESLSKFVDILNQRIASKTEQSLGKTFIKTMTLKRANADLKSENVNHMLSIAVSICNESLIYTLQKDPKKRKTTEGDEEVVTKNAQVENLTVSIVELEAEKVKLNEKIAEENRKVQTTLDTMDANLLKIVKLGDQINTLKDRQRKIMEEIDAIGQDLSKIKAEGTKIYDESLQTSLKTAIKTGTKKSGNYILKDFGHLEALDTKVDEEMNKLNTKNLELEKIENEIIKIEKDIVDINDNNKMLNNDLSTINKLENDVEVIDEAISAQNETIDKLLEQIEQYEQEHPFENPAESIKEICDKMNEARSWKDGNLIESESETNSQNKLFSEFYNALLEIPDIGTELASGMQNYVENEMNKGIEIENKNKIKINAGSPSSTIKSTTNTKKTTNDEVPLSSNIFVPSLNKLNNNNIELNTNIIHEHARLISEIQNLYSRKQAEPYSDNEKMTKLKSALDFLQADGNPYKNTITARYLEASQSENKNQHVKLENTVSGRSLFARTLNKATQQSETDKLLKEFETHVNDMQEKHPDCFSGTKNVANINITKNTNRLPKGGHD